MMLTKGCFAAFCLVLIEGVRLAHGLLSEPTPDGQHRDLETRIIGGSVADATRYPYYTYVRIGSEFESTSCGGSLIAPDVVLTAAHCLSPFLYDIPTVDVFVNSTSRKYSDTEFYRDGIKLLMHEDYKLSPRDHDIGLIFLDTPVLGVPLVKLNKNASVPITKDNYSAVTAIGLGVTGVVSSDFFPVYEYAKLLMNVQVNPISNAGCIKTYGSALIGDGNLCAGGDGLKGVCFGDSGGPLLVKGNTAQNDVQIGITSWGPGCADEGYPDVFTRVSYFAQWVDDQVCKFSKRKPATCPTSRPTRRPTARRTTTRA